MMQGESGGAPNISSGEQVWVSGPTRFFPSVPYGKSDSASIKLTYDLPYQIW